MLTDNPRLARPEPSLANLFSTGLAGGAILADRSTQDLQVSREAAELLGVEPARAVVSLKSLPAPLAEAIGALLAGRSEGARDVVLEVPSRGQVTLRLTTVPVPGRGGDGLVVVFHDLTGLKQAEASLQRLQRLASLGLLSAGLAHEIKNALVSSRTFVDLLLEKRPEAELGDVVRREIERIEVMLSRMLRFAAPGKQTRGATSINKVLDHSLRLVGRQLKEKAISLERCTEAPDLVDGDEYQLEQVFVNLFLNAVDAMGPHGVLTVTTALEGAGRHVPKEVAARRESYLRVTVRDTGIGVQKAHLERLFEPFFTTKEGSTGLGLAVTRRIIEEHEGWIAVESQPGQGTAFHVHLPACPPAA